MAKLLTKMLISDKKSGSTTAKKPKRLKGDEDAGQSLEWSRTTQGEEIHRRRTAQRDHGAGSASWLSCGQSGSRVVQADHLHCLH
jgi:hypothetical protein